MLHVGGGRMFDLHFVAQKMMINVGGCCVLRASSMLSVRPPIIMFCAVRSPDVHICNLHISGCCVLGWL